MSVPPINDLKFTLEVLNYPEAAFSVVDFRLDESYSQLYRLEINLFRPSSKALNLAMVLDQSVVLKIWENEVLQDTISGMVVDIEQGDTGFRNTHYKLVVYPDLWRLTLRKNSRIFQEQDITTIFSTILKEHRIKNFGFWLHPEKHRAREFCVQYQESDFDFLCRLAAEEGIAFYFKFKDYQQNIIFTDHTHSVLERTSVIFNANKNAQLQERVITTFRCSNKVRNSSVRLKDYTFKKPNWAAEYYHYAEDIGYQQSVYPYFEYPGRFKNGEGKNFAGYRLDSLRNDAHLGYAESNVLKLHTGMLFTLSEHPTEEWNTAWQIISVSYMGKQPQAALEESGDRAATLTNQLKFIPAYQPWRPAIPYKLRIDGPQIGIVVGPENEEIYCDNFGRVRVQFLWDRQGKFDDHSSCWIRVSQPWAGKGWGMIAIPRIGQEVIIDFLDGDPDQPIITGRTYHANNLPSLDLPANKTQMSFRSQTYKGTGYNELRFEDAPGRQLLALRAQKDMKTKVFNDQTLDVKFGNRTINVDKGNETTNLTYGNQVINVHTGMQTQTINKDQTISILKGNQITSIQEGKQDTTIKQDQKITIEGGSQIINIQTGEQNTTVNSNQNIVINKGSQFTTIQNGNQHTMIPTGQKTVNVGKDYKSNVGTTFSVNANASIELTVGDKKVLISDGSKTEEPKIALAFNDSVSIELTEGKIVLKVGKSTLTLTEDKIIAEADEINWN